jgi:hypothetical protein
MLEALRPFETPLVAPKTRIVGKPLKQPLEIATLTWGGAGTLPTAIQIPVIGGGGYKIDPTSMNNELWRITEPVKIENPDDPSQYVIVDRITKLAFQNPKGITAAGPADTTTTSTVDPTATAKATTTTGVAVAATVDTYTLDTTGQAGTVTGPPVTTTAPLPPPAS